MFSFSLLYIVVQSFVESSAGKWTVNTVLRQKSQNLKSLPLKDW